MSDAGAAEEAALLQPISWPPLSGRRRVTEAAKNTPSVPEVTPRFGRRVFPSKMSATSEAVEEARTRGERLILADALRVAGPPAAAAADEAQLAFLQIGGWQPPSHHATIPSTPSGPSRPQPHPPVSTPSPRVLSGPKRHSKAAPKKAEEHAKVDAAKLTERLYGDVERRRARREAKREAALKRCGVAVARVEDVDALVQRVAVDPLRQRQKVLEAGLKKYAARPPGRRLSPSEQRASTARLHSAALERQAATTRCLVQRYVADRGPQRVILSAESRDSCAERLYTPRR